MRPIRRIEDLARRLPEQGRIRFGTKSAKGAPMALTKFRFTSADKAAIEAIAEIYGGEPKPWAEAKHQGEWEVFTQSSKIRIVLPPDPLGDTPIYEFWQGGGIQRRCDGETAFVPAKTPDGAEMVERPCVCDANQQMACKPKTRLSVILPDIRFGGTWRLETGGWNAAVEMPGMVETIQTLQSRGMNIAALELKQESSTFAGQTKKFVVPKLSFEATVEEIVEGSARMAGLGMATPPPAELVEGDPTAYIDVMDSETIKEEEITDAEIVDEKTFPIECDICGAKSSAPTPEFAVRALAEHKAARHE